jgi:hypothetical protein
MRPGPSKRMVSLMPPPVRDTVGSPVHAAACRIKVINGKIPKMMAQACVHGVRYMPRHYTSASTSTSPRSPSPHVRTKQVCEHFTCVCNSLPLPS